MSLFDRSGSTGASTSSSSADTDEDDGVSLPVRAPPVPQHRTGPSSTSAAAAAPRSAVEQRRFMAEADAAGHRRLGHGSAPWHRELQRRRTGAVATTPAATTGGDGEQSKFGASIAAAMQLRRQEKETTLVQRLQQQRAEEVKGSDGAALAKKDQEVGVFVTASYRAVLQRNIHPSSAPDARKEQQRVSGSGASGQGNAAEEEDNDPLEAYLRQLERETRAASTPAAAAVVSSGDYYERVMKAPLHEVEERERRGGAAVVETTGARATDVASADTPSSATAEVGSLPPPTLSELQDLIGGPTPPTPAASLPLSAPEQPLSSAPAGSTTVAEAEAHSAVLAHARLVYDAREVRRLRAATEASVLALAQRCDARIAAAVTLTP